MMLYALGFIFLGISYMKEGFDTLKDSIDLASYSIGGFLGIFIYILIGAISTVVIQSSGATMAIIITALAGGNIIYIDALSLAIGAIIGISISFLNPAKENDALWFVFLCGIISVSGMTLPGFSGSFILILLGNYVLLLVDSVNALYDSFADMIKGDFSFFKNNERIRMLKVLVVFTLGSVTGLVTFSHLLSYILKHYKSITLSAIIGFIIGSLGVVWPWKKTVYKANEDGGFLLDSAGEKVIKNYKRFMPELNTETYYAIAFIILGIAIVLALEFYGKKTRKTK